MKTNPNASRLEDFVRRLSRRRIDAALVFGEANLRALAGIVCDNGCLVVRRSGEVAFITDFRYVPMVHREAPWLRTVELKRGISFARAAKRLLGAVARLGYEGSLPVSRYLALERETPRAKFVDVEADLLALRAVKTPLEIARLAAAEALNDEIWRRARKAIRPGMTEKDVQRTIRAWMNALGDGEAFETIVCAGANAAECHHVPDDTLWRRGEPLLVDMGVKLDGVCSDMTRCIRPSSCDPEYARVYRAVLAANLKAIAAARPGITVGRLDSIARASLRAEGLARHFGHSLGHGVGYEIHEAPTAQPGDATVLEPGMLVTIEPGVYIEGRLGVRIEDLIVITDTGCDVLSHAAK